MYSDRIRKYLTIALALAWGITFVYFTLRSRERRFCPRNIENSSISNEPIKIVYELMRKRQYKEALSIIDVILKKDSKNIDAIWARAEIFMRSGQDKIAKLMFKEILEKKPNYYQVLTGLAVISYREGDLKEAKSLIDRYFIVAPDNYYIGRGFAYMILGLITEKEPVSNNGLKKLEHSMKIKNYYIKACRLAPNFAEPHLQLARFYRQASPLLGGNLNKAILEYKAALMIDPAAKEAFMGLAQVYQLKKDKLKSKLYLAQLKKLDPNNKLLQKSQMPYENNAKKPHIETRVIMGTYIEVTSYDKNAAGIVFSEFKRIEDLLSKYDRDSEVSKLNRTGRLNVSKETFYIIKKCKEYWKITDGYFDITVGPLMDLWGFSDKKYTYPKETRIKDTLNKVGFDKIILIEENNLVEFKIPGMKIDLGGIAKGYALDCCVEKLRLAGINNCLINAGGQVYCMGKNLGKPWRVAIANPSSRRITKILELVDKSIATSGNYEQYFYKNNRRYAHIINPKTGYPAENTIVSVTVISESATTADALATAIFILGKNKGTELTKKFKNIDLEILQDKDVQDTK